MFYNSIRMLTGKCSCFTEIVLLVKESNVRADLFSECPTTLCSCEELMLRLEQMQALLKTEPEEADDEIVDIITVIPPCQNLKVKEEEQEADMEPKFFLGPSISAQFLSDTAQQVSQEAMAVEVNQHSPVIVLLELILSLFQIGINFQPVEVEKNVFAPAVENMILKVSQTVAHHRLIVLLTRIKMNMQYF